MKRLTICALALGMVASIAGTILAHCEVPCGIYGDQRRFEELLEDQATIAKAITNINELSKKTDATSKNQLVRWINTKESHATNSQNIIAQYFMTQKIKATDENYAKRLTAAHAVMVAAMKCKQTVADASAEALKNSIYDFYRAYEGKEPDLEN